MPMIATFAPQTYINADLKQKWLPKDVFLAIFGVVLGCWPEQGRFLGNPKRESVSEGQSILTGSLAHASCYQIQKNYFAAIVTARTSATKYWCWIQCGLMSTRQHAWFTGSMLPSGIGVTVLAANSEEAFGSEMNRVPNGSICILWIVPPTA